MSEEVVVTPDANASVESSYETPSLGEVLDKVQGKTETPTETETETAPESEPVVETQTEVVAQAPTEVADVTETETGVKPQPGFVPVAAIQSERQKRQQLEQQLQSLLILNQQLQQQQYTAPQDAVYQAPAEVDPNVVKNQVATMSEHLARQTHPDYDEKYQAFAKALQTNPQKYQPLYESIMGSEHPGEAAYRAGEQLLLAEKYGADVVNNPSKFREAIRKETEIEIKAKADADAHAKVQGKLKERSKTPTDISQARSAGGSTESTWSMPSLESTLRKVQKRKG